MVQISPFSSFEQKTSPKVSLFQKKALPLHKQSCTRQFESKFSLRSFAFTLHSIAYKNICGMKKKNIQSLYQARPNVIKAAGIQR